MAKGDAPISPIYRMADCIDHAERERRGAQRKNSLYALLWKKHGLICIHADDLPESDPLAQHVINIANDRYGRRS